MARVELTERMAGSLTVGWSSTGRNAYGHNNADSPIEIVAEIRVVDLARWLSGPIREASVRGAVDAPALSTTPLTAVGSIRWYADEPGGSHDRQLSYSLTLRDAGDRRFFVDGHKVVRSGPFTDAWPEAATLRITIRDTPNGSVIAEGTLTSRTRDLIVELASLRLAPPDEKPETLAGLARFGRMLAGPVFDYCGGIAARVAPLEPEAPPRRRQPLTAPLPELHDFLTADGVRLRLVRHRGGNRGPVVCVHGMGGSSGVFTTDTITPNLTEYLCRNGFDVWVLDWRASALLANTRGHTADACATQDFPAAAEVIARATGSARPHWVAHCAGSVVLLMSALSRLDGIASLVTLSGGLHPLTPALEEVQIGLHIPGMLERLGITSEHGVRDRAFELAATGFPLPPEERCASVACHRISCLYSLGYQHENLNPLTHKTMHERMGIASLALLRQLARCAARGRLVDANGEDAYLPELDRLRLPITFIHGDQDRVWTSESTKRSYQTLRSRFGEELYRQHILPGYGNLDLLLGTASPTEVYPLILRHLSR